MKKLILSVIVLLISPYFLQAQEESQEFQPLHSSFQSGITSVEVVSEVRLIDHLVSEENLAKLKDEEKEYVGIFNYKYTFKNIGDLKIKILFYHQRVFLSPLVGIFQDFSIALEPGEIRVIEFIANTEPELTIAPNAIAEWFSKNQKWFFSGHGFVSLYIPGRNAIYIETPTW